jgi:hypothetical protein
MRMTQFAEREIGSEATTRSEKTVRIVVTIVTSRNDTLMVVPADRNPPRYAFA